MLHDQLKQEFRNLSEGEIAQGLNSVLESLLKVRKDWSRTEAQNFVDESLTRLMSVPYRGRFSRILLGINPNGLAVSRSFTKNLKSSMELQWSIWNHFRKLDYDNSTLKKYVHNAKKVHKTMPTNSKLTLTL